MSTIVLKIIRVSPFDLNSNIRKSEELGKLVTQFAQKGTVESQARADVELKKLLHMEETIDYVKQVVRDDIDAQNRVAYAWNTAEEPSFLDEEIISQASKQAQLVVDGSVETVERALRPGHPGPGAVLLTSDGEVNIPSFYLERRNEEIATIKLTRADGRAVKLNTGEEVYTDFLLQGVTEPRQEKYQINETFGRAFLFMFGSRQEIYTFTGVLVDFKNLDWRQRFISLYRDQLRGSVTVEKGQQIRIAYRGSVRMGQLLSLTISHAVSSLNHVMFSIRMFVEDQIDLPADPTVSVSSQQEIEGLTSPEIKNQIVVRAPGIPFSVITAIRDKVFNDSNEIKSGLEKGVWKHFPTDE